MCLTDGKIYVQLHAYCKKLFQDNNLCTVSIETKAETQEKWAQIKIVEQFPGTKCLDVENNKELLERNNKVTESNASNPVGPNRHQNDECIKIKIIPPRSEKMILIKTQLNGDVL